jgi:hypothetical protein
MKIAFVYYDFSSFVRQDHDILSRHFEVEEVRYRKLSNILRMAASIWRSEISFSWFASGHSFAAVLLSKILGKRSIVVAGGYDVACVQEINYGQFTQSWLKRFMTAFSLKHADLVLPVSEFTRERFQMGQAKKTRIIYNGVNREVQAGASG